MTIYHVTTPKKARRYHKSGYIKKPVRGFDTLLGAMVWAIRTGRSVIYQVTGSHGHLLPDHHNSHGMAYWFNEDIPLSDIKCVSRKFKEVHYDTPRS